MKKNLARAPQLSSSGLPHARTRNVFFIYLTSDFPYVPKIYVETDHRKRMTHGRGCHVDARMPPLLSVRLVRLRFLAPTHLLAIRFLIFKAAQ
jgi:hypothetical protein